MSTDIIGWVEVRINEHWFGVVDIQVLMQRNYRMFDFLFGGRNDNFVDAIAGRRMPEEKSREAEKSGIWESWIGLDELLEIDWTKHKDIFTDDWKRLIEIMKLVSQTERVTDTRLIVSFF
jgi:hypothetical protein